MATSNNINVLSEAFIEDLFITCLEDDYILSMVCEHVKEDHLPDRNSAAILSVLKDYYREYKRVPTESIIIQKLAGKSGAIRFWQSACNNGNFLKKDECIELLEEYIRRVEFQKVFKKIGDVYNREGIKSAQTLLYKYSDWSHTFTLSDSEYTDVVGTFVQRHTKNRSKSNENNSSRAITRFYIDPLDEMNNGRDLRGQLTCILASTGVGKSHAARWVGSQACLDGFNVLHFQLEGSKEEVENAYSAAVVACNEYNYEKGFLKDKDVDRFSKDLSDIKGKLFVKSYPKFNQRVSTIKINESIERLKKIYNITPDVVIIDSMDLLEGSSRRSNRDEEDRKKIIGIANDLKDIASDHNVWMVVTYQSRIENKEWIDNEKNVLTEYSSAESKGIARPMTHLITLNQSENEGKEQTMRIHVAKSRFFRKGKTFKIATDYDNEQFYDRRRTMNLGE